MRVIKKLTKKIRLEIYKDVLKHWANEQNGFCFRIVQSLDRLNIEINSITNPYHNVVRDSEYCRFYPEVIKYRPEDGWPGYSPSAVINNGQNALEWRFDILTQIIKEME